jgi:hypothetical protein
MFVYAYSPTPAGVTMDDLFRSVEMVPHADVQWHPIPDRFARLTAATKIMKRQKKRFDVIVAPDDRFASMMRGFQWLHRADIIPASDTERLARVCQTRSP